MNSLLEVQKRFSQTLLMKNNDIAAYLNESCISTLDSPVSIDQNAYFMRLLETISNDYPVLKQLLGAESFNILAVGYIEKQPSCCFSLRHFAKNLAMFLRQQTEYKKQPYLAELAELEWQLVDVFDLTDCPVADCTDMKGFTAYHWPLLKIKLHASVRWMFTHWNIIDIYQAFRTETKFPELSRLKILQQYLVWRKQYSPHYRVIVATEWLILKKMESHNFSEMCQTLAELDEGEDNIALAATTYLKSWLSAGLIESVYVKQ